MTDTAYRLLLNEEYPGWLHEVKLGATTGLGTMEFTGMKTVRYPVPE